MNLASGTRLGAFEVLSLIGVGGMGEVYRATDTNLKRQVAIKVLPQTVATDPKRLARFQREAEVLAALNHPNLAHIHGLEKSGGTIALVMELVEGPTLADRIGHGPIALADALPIAKQLAEALEAAHEQGIIHRDLKPANIKVRDDGTVKVLDFGLAKMLESDVPDSSLTMSPTISVHTTQAGTILGTAAYMSPEQARGRPVDKRTDVWAFGCVLVEMLTGRRAFDAGETTSDAIAAILSREPPWTALPPAIPGRLRTLLRRCLEKDQKRRLRDIGEARVCIDDLLGGTPEEGAVSAPSDASLFRRALPWALLGSALVALAAVLALWAPWQRAPPRAPLRLMSEIGADVSLALGIGTAAGATAVLSPDGTMLAFIGGKAAGTPRLYIRRLDQLQAIALSGTDGAGSAFFSPDGHWIGFFADSKLKKVPTSGGAVIALADAIRARGGFWAEDDTIVFVPNNVGAGVMRVSSSGGQPEPLTTLADGEVTHRWPQLLPGGRAVLFTAHSNNVGFDDANVVVQSLATGRRTVIHGAYYGRYLHSGHVVYLHESTLFALPFDVSQSKVIGEAVPVLEGVTSNSVTGAAQFAASNNGTLAYLPGFGTDATIDWMTRDGRTTPLRATPANWSGIQFAPDGQRAAMMISDGKSNDVFVYDWARDTLSNLTLNSADDRDPVWTPDGRRIAFTSRRDDKLNFNLYWQRADGTGEAQRLTESKNQQAPASWHPSGKLLAFTEVNPQTQQDVMILPLEGDEASNWKPGKPTVFLNGPYNESSAAFSPDGRWLAYSSQESGRGEVYVRPFPGPGGKWLISSDGGAYPTWSRTRRELFFNTLAPDNRIMVASYTVAGDSFQAEKPHLWSEARLLPRQGTLGPTRGFDVHPDGVRVALAKAPDVDTAQDKVVFVFNFFDELRRVAPVKK